MARLSFTPNLARLVACPEGDWAGRTVGEVLDAAFRERPGARGYVLDEHGRVRKHIQIFVDGARLADRDRLTDPAGAHVFVLQALSGG
ncbi:MAG: MoaD/ThiS family protein [Deltaproteobacteria bacterium]|nr:MoaD/ThiS family protein [Deltaproteobacteria bacterium]